MQDRHIINSSYYCERSKPGGPILVLVSGGYVVAEYDERTGTANWQRVVQASQKAQIETWLTRHFPGKADAPRTKELVK